jgi:heme/copper-type cytochrome/quinol oxidase subunit 3
LAAVTRLGSVPDLQITGALAGAGSGRHRSARGADPTLGVLIFIGSEVMLFAGLLSAFIVSRAAAPFWPPPNQPRLPIVVTGFNTMVLVISAVTMWRVVRVLPRHDHASAARWMAVTTTLGIIFLVVQGREWARLIRFGLTMKSSLYGAMFYLIVGAHALHLAVAVSVLSWVAARQRRARYEADFRGVVACATYWSFVVILWPIIYALVYLS